MDSDIAFGKNTGLRPEKQPADCIRLSDYLFNSEVSNRTCVFERSVVLADGNIKGSGCKPETDEMTDVDVKARFQTGTTGNSSNQILEISDSDIARGVFYVFFLIRLCFCLA